jgi:DNA-directed RNA polymerase subunit E'/Rpb7
MIFQKTITVSLNINPKYLHRDLILLHINDYLNKNVLNNCFHNMGKILKINKIVSVGLGKIHIDTGYAQTPVTFIADIFMPKTDEIIKGTIEKYDTNGGVYVNYDNIISIYCLSNNINAILNKKKNERSGGSDNDIDRNIGININVKITKVNINDQNMIVIGKII